MIKFVAIFVGLTLASCSTESSSSPESSFVNSTAADSACVKSSFATIESSRDTVNVLIDSIDGEKTGERFGMREFCFSSGKHRLNFRAFSLGHPPDADPLLTGDMDFEFLPSKKYKLQGKQHGISIVRAYPVVSQSH